MDAKQKKQFAEALNDPVKFAKWCWPDTRLYDKQCEVLYSVRDNKETFVHAANETGKSALAAIAAIYFFASRDPVRVILTSSSENQLESILWSEIRNRVLTSRYRLPFQVQQLMIHKVDPQGNRVSPLSYMRGYVSRVVESFQGHHLPHDKARTLAIFEESSGIRDEFKEAADSWAHRLLCIGNPLSNDNFFYFSCKSGTKADPSGQNKLLRKVIHIDGLDSPNVRAALAWRRRGLPGNPPPVIPGILSWAEYQQREELWDEQRRTTRLHGHFFEGEQSMMYPALWLDESHRMHDDLVHRTKLDGDQKLIRKAKAMGVDTAQGGRDSTVWTIVDEFGVLLQVSENIADATQIAGKTLAFMREWGIPAKYVYFDAGGGGKEIADFLRAKGHRVHSVSFGARPTSATPDIKKKTRRGKRDAAETQQIYRNFRAELFGTLRIMLKPGPSQFAIPREITELRQELQPLPLLYDSEGKMFVLPKDRGSKDAKGLAKSAITIKELIGRSPDRADSLVLATFALSQRPATMSTPDVPKKSAKEMADNLLKNVQGYVANLRR